MTRTAKANPEQMQTNGVASLLYTQGAGCSIHPSPIVLPEKGLGKESEGESSNDRQTGNRSGNRKPRFATYFIQSEAGGNIKIGRATDVDRRLRDLQIGSPLKLVLLAEVPHDRERIIHEQFRSARKHGEWFAPTVELARFIEQLPRARRVIRADADSPAALAQRIALRHCSGSWLPRDDFDGWQAAVISELADNCQLSPEDAEDDLDPEDVINPSEPCPCAACEFTDALVSLRETNIYGCVCRPGMLCAVAPKPSTSIVRHSIVRKIGHLYAGFDAANISLNLIFVSREGAVEDADAFGAYMAAANPAYEIPDDDLAAALEALPASPAPREIEVPA